MLYTTKWVSPTNPNEFEYGEFRMAVDPDPPGMWKVRYQNIHKGEIIKCWVVLPKKNRPGEPSYIRREVIENRDLTCTALDMTCELLGMERLETEPLQPSLIRASLGMERSYAAIEGRQPRKFVAVYESI